MRKSVSALLILGNALLSSSTLASSNQNEQLESILKQERTLYYQENPGTAPKGTDKPRATNMRGVSEADHARRHAAWQKLYASLNTIQPDTLSEDDLLNYELMKYHLESRLLTHQYNTWRIPFFSDSGFHTAPARMWRGINFRTVNDYEAYLSQLADIPTYLNSNLQNLQKGLDTGFTMPKVVLDGLLPSFDAMVSETPEESSLYTPFKNIASTVGDDVAEELREKAKHIIAETVNPAYKQLATFMKEIYYPGATSDLAASNRPGGKAYYEAMVRYYTTLNITADEVHDIGLSEVARIRAEMEEVIKQSGFKGDFAEFLAFLRSDPQFYAKTPKELLMHASYYAKVIDGKLPSLFGKLPRQPYGVEAVPAVLAPNYTTGRYSGAPLDAPRGGYYWVNTYALDKRPLYTLAALTLHEGAPGHHLQTALSRELENVPEFRLGLYPHAFGEGWGLYTEKLGIELGVYETPYDHFGRLSYEMWRACRLVIDTGIHAKGWTRDQAVKLLEENSALSTHNIRTEVDRYISWPGQALAYKMGELKIIELREWATEQLGENFDIRAFHDRVLSAGGIPLSLLEKRIVSWVEGQKK
ncbi:MAG: DUF885 family protein [Kordiimonas sp.]